MVRRKRTSRILSHAEQRLASIESIHYNLDVGEGLTVQGYTEKIQNLREYLKTYNRTLSTIDNLLTQIVENEKDLADYSEKFCVVLRINLAVIAMNIRWLGVRGKAIANVLCVKM
ncbi:hypothetical protein NIES2107_47190 [Nostoc carneum NIES-2107]|nr:hypothetical protein NIES2107_47190 [Nostoc carneum NIES-2107]